MTYFPQDTVVITRVGSKYQGKKATLICNTGRTHAATNEPVWYVAIEGVTYGFSPTWNEYRESSFSLVKDSSYVATASIITLKDAVLAEAQDLKTIYGNGQIQQEWKKDGRCPGCGELGEYRISVPVCSNHGPY